MEELTVENCNPCSGTGLVQEGSVQKVCRVCKGKGFIEIVDFPEVTDVGNFSEDEEPAELSGGPAPEEEPGFFKRVFKR